MRGQAAAQRQGWERIKEAGEQVEVGVASHLLG